MRPLTCLALAAALAVPGLADDVLRPDTPYRGGSRVASPWTGLTFTVPAGWSGGFDGEADGFIVQKPGTPQLLAVYGYSEGGLDDVGEVVVTLIQETGIRLAQIGEERPDARTLDAVFQAMTDEGPGVLVGRVRTGEPGNAIAVAALGRADAQSAMTALVRQVVDSVAFSLPEARAWRSQLAGQALSTSGGGSTYSSGGAGGYGSHASSSHDQIDFCSDGTYAYSMRSESYISIEGASAESVKSDQHAGRWWLVADLVGQAYVVLEATDGRVFHWPIRETETGAVLNGTSYGAGASGRCR